MERGKWNVRGGGDNIRLESLGGITVRRKDYFEIKSGRRCERFLLETSLHCWYLRNNVNMESTIDITKHLARVKNPMTTGCGFNDIPDYHPESLITRITLVMMILT
ncbi:uncharacterized protein LOC135166687 [Diachasmimorpha longicaudata]|uniref:uncharacterized protein LOC135166687 n=1 Tax=Diachasmimorpha longicaudata TaxID=58733 RepID=UPI0030B8B261